MNTKVLHFVQAADGGNRPVFRAAHMAAPERKIISCASRHLNSVLLKQSSAHVLFTQMHVDFCYRKTEKQSDEREACEKWIGQVHR